MIRSLSIMLAPLLAADAVGILLTVGILTAMAGLNAAYLTAIWGLGPSCPIGIGLTLWVALSNAPFAKSAMVDYKCPRHVLIVAVLTLLFAIGAAIAIAAEVAPSRS